MVNKSKRVQSYLTFFALEAHYYKNLNVTNFFYHNKALRSILSKGGISAI